MMSWMRLGVVGLGAFFLLGLVDRVYSTQQYPVFSSPKFEMPTDKSGRDDNPTPDISTKPNAKAKTNSKNELNQKQKSVSGYQYNGFVTVNESRRFFVNAKPLSQSAELKLVSVLNAGRSLVLQHKTRGQINLHLGQSTSSSK